ncbi:MAG: 4Fe-4S binding protein [Candidatus Atribacteria bacterium]|jgi:2-oxoglutarate ferredoxin oxidoreductase subunit delta|nr:4Fe-4S binding protein [Candidatus Atribacteria bacterium]
MNKNINQEIYENEKTIITINEDWCKACGICIQFCPAKVLVSSERGHPVVKNIEDCIHCRLCELRCPDFVINVVKKEENLSPSLNQKGLED